MEALTGLDRLLERVTAGGMLDADDAQLVLESHDLITIGMMADAVRRRMHGARTTFCRVFEVHVDVPPPVVPARTSAGEFRIAGRPASLEAARACVAATRAAAGTAVVTGFALHDLAGLGDTPRAFDALKAAGLDAIAEVVLDQSTADTVTLIGAARASGLLVQRLTVHAMPPEERLQAIQRARDLQAAAGDLQAFAPLPRTMSITAPTTGYDDVKLIAVARMLVQNIPFIQVDWPLYGPKLAQVALTVGADDVDGVLAADPGVLGTRRSPIEEIRGNIRAASLEPVERDGRYQPRDAAVDASPSR